MELNDDGESFDRGNPLAAEIEEVPNLYREASLKANRFYTKGIAYIYPAKENFRFVFECWLLAMEMYDVLGVDDDVKLATRWVCTKANVNKVVKQIQRRIGKEGRRSKAGCKNMSNKRKEQLQ